MVQRTFFTAYCITPNLFCQGVCKKKHKHIRAFAKTGNGHYTFKHRDSRTKKDFRAGVLRQRHGCSPDRGDCHSFHFPPRRLRELKKKLHFFIKGLDKTKNHAMLQLLQHGCYWKMTAVFSFKKASESLSTLGCFLSRTFLQGLLLPCHGDYVVTTAVGEPDGTAGGFIPGFSAGGIIDEANGLSVRCRQ